MPDYTPYLILISAWTGIAVLGLLFSAFLVPAVVGDWRWARDPDNKVQWIAIKIQSRWNIVQEIGSAFAHFLLILVGGFALYNFYTVTYPLQREITPSAYITGFIFIALDLDLTLKTYARWQCRRNIHTATREIEEVVTKHNGDASNNHTRSER